MRSGKAVAGASAAYMRELEKSRRWEMNAQACTAALVRVAPLAEPELITSKDGAERITAFAARLADLLELEHAKRFK